MENKSPRSIKSPEDIAYIVAHYNVDRSAIEMADHFGITPRSFVNRMKRFRQNNPGVLSKFSGDDIGKQSRRKEKGGRYAIYQKFGSGDWRIVRREDEHGNVFEPREKKEKSSVPPVKRKPKPSTNTQRKIIPAKKSEPILKANDEAKFAMGYRYVEIKNKTWALLPPDTTS